MILKTWGDNL